MNGRSLCGATTLTGLPPRRRRGRRTKACAERGLGSTQAPRLLGGAAVVAGKPYQQPWRLQPPAPHHGEGLVEGPLGAAALGRRHVDGFARNLQSSATASQALGREWAQRVVAGRDGGTWAQAPRAHGGALPDDGSRHCHSGGPLALCHGSRWHATEAYCVHHRHMQSVAPEQAKGRPAPHLAVVGSRRG